MLILNNDLSRTKSIEEKASNHQLIVNSLNILILKTIVFKLRVPQHAINNLFNDKFTIRYFSIFYVINT
jgi:hypothetical protein